MTKSHALAESLAPVEAIPADGWTPCAACGEEWRLAEGLTLCPPCAEEALRQRQAEARRRWCRENRAGSLARGQVPSRLHPAVAIKRWPSDPRNPETTLTEWQGEPWSVTLLGEPGVGKSTLAAELVHRWAAEHPGADLLWRRATRLLRELLQGDPMGERARACGLLALDDFGNGLANKTAWAMMGELIAERHEWNRPTVLTTGLKYSVLEAAHSPTADRLREGLLCRLPGRSRRGQQSGQG